MANKEHLQRLIQGADAWNKWRAENPDTIPDLQDADLRKFILADVELAKEKVDDKIFDWKSTLWMHHAGICRQSSPTEIVVSQGFNFSYANMRRANLECVWLTGADFRHTDLRGANLAQATLNGVLLSNADLRGAILDSARCHGSVFFEADLSRVKACATQFIRTQLQMSNFDHAEAMGADFSWSAIDHANFQSARLCQTVFRRSTLINVNFRGADIAWANLSDTHISGVEFDDEMNCRGTYVYNSLGSQRFVRHVMDMDYIKETSEKYPLKYFIWKYTSDCGRSWELLSVICLFILGLFAVLFDLVGVKSSLLTSIMAFTSFGFVDTAAHPPKELALICIEAILGYIMFGALVSLVASSMARRSG